MAGGNIERDIKTFLKISKKFKISKTFEPFILKSKIRKNWPYNTLSNNLSSNIKNICILGLAYKDNTNSIKNSASIEFIKKIKKKKIKISVYDPVVKKINNNYKNIYFKKSAMEAINNSDVLLVLTPWKEFSKLQINKIIKNMKGNIIIDPYKMMNLQKYKKKIKYFSLGNKN